MDTPLTIGSAAPDFSLQSTDGQPVTLSSLRGKRVVLYFYPKDDTPGCTKEACSFRDHAAQLKASGAVVLGVSRDTLASHQRFAEKFHLTFPLLSDPDAAVCKAYGAYTQKSMFPRPAVAARGSAAQCAGPFRPTAGRGMYGRTYWGIERRTVLIDEAGRIMQVFPKVKVDGHTDEVLAALAAGREA